MAAHSSLRHAWRSLLRAPAFTLTAVLTLVIGIAATVAIFAVINGVLLRPLPYGSPDRLVGAWHDLPPLNLFHIEQTNGTYLTYKRLARTIEGIGLYDEGAVNLADPSGATDPQRIAAAWLSKSVIEVLQVYPVIGRNFNDAEDLPNGPDVVILSHTLWQNRFGAERSVIGRRIDVNGRSREVIGVMPAHFRFPDASTQLWMPIAIDPNAQYTDGFNNEAVARLKPGVTIAEAERDFAEVLPRVAELYPMMAPNVPTKMVLEQGKPRPLLRALRDDMTQDVATTLWMVGAAAVLVLLVACFNVANLILVRADARQRELALREALGAGRGRVLAHFLSESVVLAGVAAVLGLGVAWAAVRALVALGPADLPRLSELGIDAATVAFTVALTFVVALVCSIIPALRIGRVDLSNALREGGRTGTAGRTRHRVRGALVAAQIALALVVLAGSGLLLRTFQRLNAVRPGFDPERVATLWISTPAARYAGDSSYVRFYARLLAGARELPGVQSVGLTSRLPLDNRNMNKNPFYPEGDASYEQKIPPLQIYTTVDGGYFDAMRIPLVAGRTFDRLERQRWDEVVISRHTAVTFWHDSTGRAAVGKRFRGLPGGPWFTVIGVAEDIRDTALAAPPSGIVYYPQVAGPDDNASQSRRTMALVLRTSGDPLTITGPIRALMRDMDPMLPLYDIRPMTEVVQRSMARLSFITIVLGAAAVVTLLLGAIGLYGVMTYLVTLRTRELGVRLALGAQPREVATMMTRQGLVLTGIGVAGGLALFVAVARFLRSFLFGVAPGDPVTLVAASLMLVAIAALASWIPARRAARVDPALTLRAE